MAPVNHLDVELGESRMSSETTAKGARKMDYDVVRLQLEKTVSDQLRERFRGDLIERILREGQVESSKNYLKSILEGHSFKVTERMMPKLHATCHEIQQRLEFDEPIEYYITSSAAINAAAYPRLEEDQSHLVMINSASLERFTDDELKFVIGHEMGHLLSKNSELVRIIGFVFPDAEQIPLIFQTKLELWNQLSELSSDRYGYIAMPNLDTSIRAFFKMSSGLDVERFDFDAQAYLEEMDKVLDYFRKESPVARSTHPINPVRLKALQYFSESELYRKIAAGNAREVDEALRGKMDDLLTVLLRRGTSELDEARKRFVATGGIIVAGADEQMSPDEADHILGPLASVTSFPRKFLEEVMKEGDLGAVFSKAAQTIFMANPAERYPMFAFLMDIALADRAIRDREVELLFEIGEKVFGFSRKEIAQQIGGAIQKGFVPRFVS
ncbi:MAG: M48 family metalloprotease [Candidatus Eisenbacteria bacterium]|nr:M48 family metalloprotease [Candidatus Eisenbacteria bacterium]